MVTGGDDRKVNMWALGKPNVIMVCNADLLFHDIYTFDRTDFHDKLFSWIIVTITFFEEGKLDQVNYCISSVINFMYL